MTPPDPYGAVVTWVDRPPLDGPLQGLRVGIKDVIAVRGVPRLCGAPGITDPAPQEQDAEAVARLVAAGARIVATTATHPFSWGVVTPATTNPRAPDRIAGGSSGGAGAALAAGLIDGALGTDTAGSVRIPAACCGVVGLKTTEGLVPRGGAQPLSASLDTIGPMARDVATVAALLTALTGAQATPDVSRPRIGVVREIREGPLDDEIRAAWDDALRRLRGAGAEIRDVTLPLWRDTHPATGRIVASEGYKVHAETLARHADQLAPEDRQTMEASRGLSTEKVLAARRTAALFRDSLVGVFQSVDVLVAPVLPCRVPQRGRSTVVIAGQEEALTSALTRLNGPWNLAGVPAGAVPVGRDGEGGPIAVQVVGPWRRENLVLGLMALLERLHGGPWPPVEAATS